MKRLLGYFLFAVQIGLAQLAFGETASKVVDVPTRAGVTQRFLYLSPASPKAAVILFAGGEGELQISPDGAIKKSKGNFLVRTRELFADGGLAVAVVDAPSDHQRYPFLGGFRDTPEHVADIKAVIAWLKQETKLPVWLVGTSRGTESAAFIATQLSPANGGPDGLVLTSTILTDTKERPVTDMPLEKLSIPVLVVHHEQDGCKLCAYSNIPRLMDKLPSGNKKELITMHGGNDRGDPCEAFAHHGFNGQGKDVVEKIADWIKAR